MGMWQLALDSWHVRVVLEDGCGVSLSVDPVCNQSEIQKWPSQVYVGRLGVVMYFCCAVDVTRMRWGWARCVRGGVVAGVFFCDAGG